MKAEAELAKERTRADKASSELEELKAKGAGEVDEI